MKIAILAAFSVLILAGYSSTPASAESQYFDTGNDYWGRCANGESMGVMCTATASAYLDMMVTLGYDCKNRQGVDRTQAKDILVKYLREHPEERHVPAAFLAIFAFERAFRCAPPNSAVR